jgi:tRNA threonylcarbamoyladenosine biosynthesis protein TsaE
VTTLVLAATAEDTRALGERVAGLLRAGDLLVLSGDLGAGKTTFTQGIGTGLGVRGPVTSPTFVISRVHPSLVGGPALVHVDAYRLGGLPELDDLDLDTSLEDAVTVVEWGSGVAEALAEDRLDIEIRRPHGDPAAAGDAQAETRTLLVTPMGRRWSGVDLEGTLIPGTGA